jgi:hypothetical protein
LTSCIHLPALPSLGRVLLSPPPALLHRPQRYYAGSDSSPARNVPTRPLCFLCFAVRTSRPQPRHGPGHHHLIHVGVTGRVLSPRLRQGIANSPNHNAETGSLSCGLLVHFRLLPTPPPADTHSRTTQLPSATCGVTSHGLDFHLLTKQHRTRTIPRHRGGRCTTRPGSQEFVFDVEEHEVRHSSPANAGDALSPAE